MDLYLQIGKWNKANKYMEDFEETQNISNVNYYK